MCRQLGFLGTGARAYSFASYGRGTGPIVLDDVQCTGLEAYITDCPSNGLYIHNCRHYEDAGVSCVGEYMYIPYSAKFSQVLKFCEFHEVLIVCEIISARIFCT